MEPPERTDIVRLAVQKRRWKVRQQAEQRLQESVQPGPVHLRIALTLEQPQRGLVRAMQRQYGPSLVLACRTASAARYVRRRVMDLVAQLDGAIVPAISRARVWEECATVGVDRRVPKPSAEEVQAEDAARAPLLEAARKTEIMGSTRTGDSHSAPTDGQGQPPSPEATESHRIGGPMGAACQRCLASLMRAEVHSTAYNLHYCPSPVARSAGSPRLGPRLARQTEDGSKVRAAANLNSARAVG